MKVLFVKQFPDRSEVDLALRLHEQGVFIRVLAHPQANGIAPLVAAGLHIASAAYTSKISFALIRQIRRLVKEEGFDILHSSDGKGMANMIWASYFLPVKIVGYRGTLAKIRRSDPSYYLGILNPRVDHVICVNQSIYDYMQEFFPVDKLTLNYKGYSLEWADEALKLAVDPVDLPQDAFVVGCVANTRGRPFKGLRNLVEAMHQLANTKVHLCFIGDYDDDVLAFAKQGPAADRIHFLGTKPNAASYMQFFDVFVLPSLRDGLPRAIKEAMAQSLAVVTTKIDGPSELVVPEESGLWVEPGSSAALADAISRLEQDRAFCKSLGEAARVRLQEVFSTETFVEKTLAVYRKVLADKSN